MAENKMVIQSEKRGDVSIVSVQGVLDAATAPEFDAKVRGMISSGQAKLVCDLKGLTFIASAGLGILSALRKQCSSAGGELRIARPTREVLDVFELLSFSKLFKIADTLEGSLKDF